MTKGDFKVLEGGNNPFQTYGKVEEFRSAVDESYVKVGDVKQIIRDFCPPFFDKGIVDYICKAVEKKALVPPEFS